MSILSINLNSILFIVFATSINQHHNCINQSAPFVISVFPFSQWVVIKTMHRLSSRPSRNTCSCVVITYHVTMAISTVTVTSQFFIAITIITILNTWQGSLGGCSATTAWSSSALQGSLSATTAVRLIGTYSSLIIRKKLSCDVYMLISVQVNNCISRIR